MKVLTFAFDLDNTLCTSIRRYHPEDILKVKPKKIFGKLDKTFIDIVKELKVRGHKIVIFTRRNACGGNARNLTKKWLKMYNVPYDKLITNKPHYDLFIGDRTYSIYQSFITSQIIEGQAKFANRENKKHCYKPKRKK